MVLAPEMDETQSVLTLADYRRRVHELYALVRDSGDPEAAWRKWRDVRDELFRSHPQSALDPARRAGFPGLAYFDYDPGWRLAAELEPVEPSSFAVPHSADGATPAHKVGKVRLTAPGGEPFEVCVYWLDAYGGGLFLPFRDGTAGTGTYGGGRYLLDTVKGADLGGDDRRLVLDFNFAYHPSCVYSARWSCPLAPPENRVAVPIRAGERLAG